MKHIKLIALSCWVFGFILGISPNMDNYSLNDWIIIIGVFLIPFITPIIRMRRNIKKIKECPLKTDNLPTELTVSRGSNSQSALSYEYNRSDAEEHLISDFFTEFQQTLTLAEEKLYSLVNDIGNGKDLDDRILRVRKVISHYEHFKSFCYSKGPGGQMYFQDMWEHCHNAKNPDFDYIDQYNELLDKWVKQKDSNDEMTRIRLQIIDIIKEHPGILQKDIYALFDSTLKDNIRSEMMQLEKDGVVRREKMGNTYQLYIL